MYGFGKALDVLRDGDLVTRKSWAPMDPFGVQPFIQLTQQVAIPAEDGEGNRVMLPALMKLVSPIDDVYLEPWAPTHADLLAEDWETAT